MMKHSKSMREDAISPVIGVMLMLVVTVIVAALASAYAGGMAESQKATPSVILTGTYSQSGGMTITHASGDPVSLTEVEFRTVPSELFGADAEKFSATFPKTILNATGNNPVINATTGFYYKPAFVAGDVLSIIAADCDDYATDADLVGTSKTNKLILGKVNANAQNNWGEVVASDPSDKAVYFRTYQFQNPANIGKYFYLDMVDPTGNRIARAKVLIEG